MAVDVDHVGSAMQIGQIIDLIAFLFEQGIVFIFYDVCEYCFVCFADLFDAVEEQLISFNICLSGVEIVFFEGVSVLVFDGFEVDDFFQCLIFLSCFFSSECLFVRAGLHILSDY